MGNFSALNFGVFDELSDRVSLESDFILSSHGSQPHTIYNKMMKTKISYRTATIRADHFCLSLTHGVQFVGPDPSYPNFRDATVGARGLSRLLPSSSVISKVLVPSLASDARVLISFCELQRVFIFF
jgi:hypothetical protein